jgi:hypothetical protein
MAHVGRADAGDGPQAMSNEDIFYQGIVASRKGCLDGGVSPILPESSVTNQPGAHPRLFRDDE